MKIYFAGDHAGFLMKQKLMEFVRSLGHDVFDVGPTEYVAGDDYPEYVIPLARKVASYSPFPKGSTPSSEEGFKSSALADSATSFKKGGIGDEVRGIIFAGSGQGEIIAANRIPGARAVLYYGGVSPEILKVSRDHNDSNILSMGARFVSEEEAKAAITVWLAAPFSNDPRHVRRLAKIEEATKSNF